MLSGKELFKNIKYGDKSVPQKGGAKDFHPDDSWLQAERLEAFHQERKSVLGEQRIERRCSLVTGERNPDKHLVELHKEMGKFWTHMGFVDSSRKWLYPEEALFLMETNVLETWYKELPVSIQQAYVSFLDKGLSLEEYIVYSHLRRLGYVVLRHQGKVDLTCYEKKIRLDQHIDKKRKRKMKKESENVEGSTSEKDIMNIDIKKSKLSSEDDFTDIALPCGTEFSNIDSSHSLENIEGSTSEKDVMNEDVKKSKLSSEDDFTDIVLQCGTEFTNIDSSHSLENKGSNSDFQESGELFSKENTKEKLEKQENYISDPINQDSHMEVDETLEARNSNCVLSYYVSDNKYRYKILKDEMNWDQHLHCGDIFKSENVITFKHSNWNFAEINFPDIGKDKIIYLNAPNSKLLPSGLELSRNDVMFEAEKYRKMSKILNQKRQKKSDKDTYIENLDFSYSIMLGQSKISAQNWSEYKQKLLSDVCNKIDDYVSPVEHLWKDDIVPLIQPQDATNTGNILQKLQVIENFSARNEISSGSETDNSVAKISFDVYLPDAKFRKSHPGFPNHRVCVVRRTDPPPDMRQINSLQSLYKDNVPLNWAVVDSGEIAFYTFSDITLPVDITMG